MQVSCISKYFSLFPADHVYSHESLRDEGTWILLSNDNEYTWLQLADRGK